MVSYSLERLGFYLVGVSEAAGASQQRSFRDSVMGLKNLDISQEGDQEFDVYGATETSDVTISVSTYSGRPCISISDSFRNRIRNKFRLCLPNYQTAGALNCL